MYENIKGISVQGKCFEKLTNLNFFNEDTQRISLIFGRNGSGKSTISNALYKYSINDSSSKLKCDLKKIVIKILLMLYKNGIRKYLVFPLLRRFY